MTFIRTSAPCAGLQEGTFYKLLHCGEEFSSVCDDYLRLAYPTCGLFSDVRAGDIYPICELFQFFEDST